MQDKSQKIGGSSLPRKGK